MKTSLVSFTLMALLSVALSPYFSTVSGAAIGRQQTHQQPESTLNKSNNFSMTAKKYRGDGSFFEPLTGSLKNFQIPDNTGPDRWACSYVKEAIGKPSIHGTSIAIDRKSSRKPFSCGELVYAGRPNYGVYSVEMISTKVRGHITAFFLIAPNSASEIDVELTGLDSTVVWLNIWKDGKQSPRKIPLGFDASKGFHTYEIEWRKDFIAWSVDGKQILKTTDIDTRDPAKTQYRLALNSWTQAADEDDWAGKFRWPGKVITSKFRSLRYRP
ncbi:hypothetical protein BG004_004426 [Podila humilis]|nr:hypothetical protein BG004_004426 [Podila humilis]